MPKMKFTFPRATHEETLAFANVVRKAGGGNPLDALMPAVPEDSSQCLIAKNLNFNCRVDVLDRYDSQIPLNWGRTEGGSIWAMCTDASTATAIGTALELPLIELRAIDKHEDEIAVLLPAEIGQVAEDFDRIANATSHDVDNQIRVDPDATPKEREALVEFAALVDVAYSEGQSLATLVNEKGEIIL